MARNNRFILTFILILIGLGYSQGRKVETDTLKARSAFKIKLSGTWYDRSSFFGFLNSSNELQGSTGIAAGSVTNDRLLAPYINFSAGDGLYGSGGQTYLGSSILFQVNVKPPLFIGTDTIRVSVDDSTITITNDTLHVLGGAGTLDSSGVRVIVSDSLGAYFPVTNANLAGSITDSKLNQITTANKVAGSAVQLNSSGAISNSSGLKVNVDDASIEITTNALNVKDAGIDWDMAAGDLKDSVRAGYGGTPTFVNNPGGVTISDYGVDSLEVIDGSIITAKLDDEAVTEPKLADEAVSPRTLADTTVKQLTFTVPRMAGTQLVTFPTASAGEDSVYLEAGSIYFMYDKTVSHYFRLITQGTGYDLDHNQMLVLDRSAIDSVGTWIYYSDSNAVSVIAQTSYDFRKHMILLFWYNAQGFSSGLWYHLWQDHLREDQIPDEDDFRHEYEYIKTADLFYEGTPAQQSMTRVTDSTIWVFGGAAGDFSNTSYIEEININTGTGSTSAGYRHQLGHANAVDYNFNIDAAILGNQANTVQNPPYIIIIDSVLSQAILDDTLEFAEADTIHFPSIGGYPNAANCNAVWADTSGDFIYLSFLETSIDSLFFAKIELGKGSRNLSDSTQGYGTFQTVADSDFNATARVVKLYRMTHYGYEYMNLTPSGSALASGAQTQGMSYSPGTSKLYFGNGYKHGNRILEITFDDGVQKEATIGGDHPLDNYSISGYWRITRVFEAPIKDTPDSHEPEGLCIINDMLYGAFNDPTTAQPTRRQIWRFPLFNEQSGQGAINDTIHFPFKNLRTPYVWITPYEHASIVTADLYIKAVTPDYFIVKSVSQSSGDYRYFWRSPIQ